MLCAEFAAPTTNYFNIVLSSLTFSCLSVPPSWWCSANHCPSNNNTFHRLQQCAWGLLLLHGWWQYYWQHCSFGGGSRFETQCCIQLTQSCLSGCSFCDSITNSLSLISLPLAVVGAQVHRQLGKDVYSISLLAPSIAICSKLIGPCGAVTTSLSNSWHSSFPTTGSKGNC